MGCSEHAYMYLHFLWFLNAEMAQVAKTLTGRLQERLYLIWAEWGIYT